MTIKGKIDFDDTADALAAIQRRKLLVNLLEHNPQSDSTVVIADSDTEIDVAERSAMMYHTHLPKLADYGLIERDTETHEVMKGPNFDEIKPLLELLDRHENKLPADWL